MRLLPRSGARRRPGARLRRSRPPTRKVFATTIAAYATDLGLLGQRPRDVAAAAARAIPTLSRPPSSAPPARLALRVQGPHRRARPRSATSPPRPAPEADRRAPPRALDEPPALRRSAMRRELEALAAEPGRVGAAPLPPASRPTPISSMSPARARGHVRRHDRARRAARRAGARASPSGRTCAEPHPAAEAAVVGRARPLVHARRGREHRRMQLTSRSSSSSAATSVPVSAPPHVALEVLERCSPQKCWLPSSRALPTKERPLTP